MPAITDVKAINVRQSEKIWLVNCINSISLLWMSAYCADPAFKKFEDKGKVNGIRLIWKPSAH